MELVQAIVLGAVQGVTEFLPVSSSGHLILFPELFGWAPQGIVFDVTVHVATLCAVFIALRKDIMSVVRGVMKGDKASRLLVIKIFAATIPIVIVGGLWGSFFETFRSTDVVAVSLIIWGVLLGLADRYTALMRGQVAELTKVRWWQAMLIGAIQVFALIPGTSRSGATMTAGLLSGVDRATAARFSFLLAIPAILGAATTTAFDVAQTGLDLPVESLLAGFVSALIFGILAIQLLLIILRRSTFLAFAIYRVALGVFLLLYL